MFRKVCRLCLGTDDLIWIFNDKMAENMQEIVYLTGGVKICKTDPITQMVCSSCCQITIKMYKFRISAVKNDDDLKTQYANFRVSQLSKIQSKPPIPEKYKHAHFSIKEVIRQYPHLKLPESCLKSHVGVYITLLADEVDEWFKERNYTDQEIEELKKEASKESVPKKRKNVETKEKDTKKMKLDKPPQAPVKETEVKSEKNKKTTDIAKVDGVAKNKNPDTKEQASVKSSTKKIKLEKLQTPPPSKAPNKKIVEVEEKKEIVKADNVQNPKKKPKPSQDKETKPKEVVKEEDVQNPKTKEKPSQDKATSKPKEEQKIDTVENSMKPQDIAASKTPEVEQVIVPESRARKAKLIAEQKIKYPTGERPLSPTNFLMRKMMTPVPSKGEDKEKRLSCDSVNSVFETKGEYKEKRLSCDSVNSVFETKGENKEKRLSCDSVNSVFETKGEDKEKRLSCDSVNSVFETKGENKEKRLSCDSVNSVFETSVDDIQESSNLTVQLSVPDSIESLSALNSLIDDDPQENSTVVENENVLDRSESPVGIEMVSSPNQGEEERDSQLEETTVTPLEMKTPKLHLTRIDEDEDLRNKYQAAFEDTTGTSEEFESMIYCTENIPTEEYQDEDVVCISDEESEKEDSSSSPKENRLKLVGMKEEILGNISADASDVEILKRVISRQKRKNNVAEKAKSLPPIEKCSILTGKSYRVKIFKNLHKYLYHYKIPIQLKCNMKCKKQVVASYRKSEPRPPKRLSDLWNSMEVVDIKDVSPRHRPLILHTIKKEDESLPVATTSKESLPNRDPPPLAPATNRPVSLLKPKLSKSDPPPLTMRKPSPGVSRVKVSSRKLSHPPPLTMRKPSGVKIRPAAPGAQIKFMNGRPVLVYSSAPGTSSQSTVVSAANLILGSGSKVTTANSTPLVLHSSQRPSTSTVVSAANLILSPGSKVTTANGTPLVLNTSQALGGSKYTTFILVSNSVLPAQQGPLPKIQSVGTVIEEITSAGATSTVTSVVQATSTRVGAVSTSTVKQSETQSGIRVKDLKSLT